MGNQNSTTTISFKKAYMDDPELKLPETRVCKIDTKHEPTTEHSISDMFTYVACDGVKPDSDGKYRVSINISSYSSRLNKMVIEKAVGLENPHRPLPPKITFVLRLDDLVFQSLFRRFLQDLLAPYGVAAEFEQN